LLASAGSAGLRERVGVPDSDAARLWPTFNLVELDAKRVHVQALSFSPKRSGKAPIRRDLAEARLVTPKWEPIPVSFRPVDAPFRVSSDQADYELSASLLAPGRYDVSCERRVELEPGANLRRYVDFVHAVPLIAPRTRRLRRVTRRFALSVGDVTRYRIDHGLCRTLHEGSRSYGAGTAFEWVGLLCRYGAKRATLRLARNGAEWLEPFASVTDLATGREQPTALAVSDEHWSVTKLDCAARVLLRIYWPLDHG
jgi:hypothetical protein